MRGDSSLAPKPDTVSYNDVISAFEKGAELRGHLRSKSHSMRCICSRNSSPGLRPDVITYNAAISACEKGPKGTACAAYVQNWQPRGLLRTVSTYDAAIGAGEKGQKYALHMSKKRQLLGLL